MNGTSITNNIINKCINFTNIKDKFIIYINYIIKKIEIYILKIILINITYKI